MTPHSLTVLPSSLAGVPSVVTDAGAKATRRYIEFFTAEIRNPRTRRAYSGAVGKFFAWCERHHLTLETVEPVHVAAFIEQLGRSLAAPSVKLHLAAVRMLYDWLVLGQVVPVNPAASVRGPKHIVKKGKTPIPSTEEARALLDSIPKETLIGLRDRAVIGTLLYTFARVGATTALRVEDYFPQGKRWWLRLHEKGGKVHDMPVHHCLEEYLDVYLAAAKLDSDRKAPLFRTAYRKTGKLTDRPMRQEDVFRMIRRRAADAGVKTAIGCHSFRALGITAYLENGGTLEKAQQMAGHSSPLTTKLYDRTTDQVTLDEVEKIVV
jgi:site-specific recombinase XerD